MSTQFTFKAQPNDNLEAPEDKEKQAAPAAAPAAAPNPLEGTVAQLQSSNATLQRQIQAAADAVKAAEKEAADAKQAHGKELVSALAEQIRTGTTQKAALLSEGKYTEAGELDIKIGELQGRKHQLEPLVADDKAPAPAAAPAQAAPAPAAPAQVQPTHNPVVNDYIAKNQWYGTDKSLAASAQMIDKQLGYEQKLSATDPAYFAEMNRRLRLIHPDSAAKFVDTVDAPAPATSAPATSAPTESPSPSNARVDGITQKKGEFNVSLTADEVATARVLGVSQEDYAKNKLQLAKDRGEI